MSSKTPLFLFISTNEQWWIQEFQNQERGSSAVEFLGTGDCFDVPSNTPNIFVVRVGNKIHIVNIACWPQLKYLRVMQSKFTKTNPTNFSNGVARTRCAGPGSTFDE